MSQAGTASGSGGGGSGITTIDVDASGSVTGSTIQLYATPGDGSANAGSSVAFIAASATEIDLQLTDASTNTLIGNSAGSATPGSGNTGLGQNALSSLNSMISNLNTAVGYYSGYKISSGVRNTLIGESSGNLLTTGQYNTFLGSVGGQGAATSSYNILIGVGTGTARSFSNSNILIGSTGADSESNTIRIGSQGTNPGQQSTCYIAGIYNNDSSGFSSPLAVYVDSSTGQLGYGSGAGSITINVDASGSVSGSTLDLYATSGDGSANAGATMAFIAASGTEIDLQTTDANGNIALGSNAFLDNGTGSATYSTVIGQSAGYYGDAWSFTCAYGFQAGVCSGTSGTNTIANSCFFGADCASGALAATTDDSFYGYNIGPNYVGGSGQNTIVGSQAIGSLVNGTLNFVGGYLAGSAWNGSESGNIILGASGVSGDTNVTRIGFLGGSETQTACYIDGINSVDSSGFTSPLAVFVDSATGQLGYGSGGGGGIVTIDTDNSGSVTGSTVSLEATSTGTWNFSGSGTAIVLNAFDSNSNLCIGSSINVSATGSYNMGLSAYTSLFNQLTTGTYNVAISTDGFSNLTTGSYNTLIGYFNGSNYTGDESANILINHAGVNGENNAIHIGTQGTGTGQQSTCFIAGINNVDSSGFTSPLAVYVDSLTGQLGYGSGGGGGGVTSLTGNAGSPTETGAITLTTGASNANGTALFTATSGTLTLSSSDSMSNTGWGTGALAAAVSLTPGSCTAFGAQALTLYNNSSGYQTAVGQAALQALTTSNSGAAGNTAVGGLAGYQLASGDGCTLIGAVAGGNYVATESFNICIGYDVLGTASENNAIHIADSGSQVATSCFIGGISGVTVASSAAVLIDTSTGQLGTIPSAARYKENIEDMDDASEIIYKLRPVRYNLKDHPEFGMQTGLVADEVQQVAPRLVSINRKGQPESVAYHELPALLLNEIQKLSKKIAELEKRIPV